MEQKQKDTFLDKRYTRREIILHCFSFLKCFLFFKIFVSKFFSRYLISFLNHELYLNMDYSKEIQSKKYLIETIKIYDQNKAALLSDDEDSIYILKDAHDYYNYKDTELEYQEIIERIFLNILRSPDDIFYNLPNKKIINSYEEDMYNTITKELFKENCDFSDQFKIKVKKLIEKGNIDERFLLKKDISITNHKYYPLITTISLAATLTNTTVGTFLSGICIDAYLSILCICGWYAFNVIRTVNRISNITSNIILVYMEKIQDKNNEEINFKIILQITKNGRHLVISATQNINTNKITINAISISKSKLQEYTLMDDDYKELYRRNHKRLLDSDTKIIIEDGKIHITATAKDVDFLTTITISMVVIGIALMGYLNIIETITASFAVPFIQIIASIIIQKYSNKDKSIDITIDIPILVDSIQKLKSLMNDVTVFLKQNPIVINLGNYTIHSILDILVLISEIVLSIIKIMNNYKKKSLKT